MAFPKFFGLAFIIATFMGCATAFAQTNEKVMVVFDGSNSMWGQIDGIAKIEIARGVMANLLGDWTSGRAVGLMAYGHRRRGDCSDIEVLVEPNKNSRETILNQVRTITPTGKTPLTDAVEQAAKSLSYSDQPATVVLISDGVESCERDPCALAQTLERTGVSFTAHVVGFGLGKNADTASLSCIARETGGEFLSAENAKELSDALTTVSTAMAEERPKPEPIVEPELPEVTLSGPETALAGSSFQVGWDQSFDKQDFVTIVPIDAEEGEYGNYIRVRDAYEANLRAPAQIGLYELRYMSASSRKVLGKRTIEITEPEVTITGPETALAGQKFPVEWTGTVDGQDFITIVPMGSDEGAYTNYFRVQDKSKNDLQAPAETGMYELRYVLDEGRRTMASQTIEITEPEVTVSAPKEVRAGDKMKVTWTGTVDAQDYITIVPLGTPDDQSGDYFRVRNKTENDMAAPEQTGLYELRYVLDEGRRVLARQQLEVLAADAQLESGASINAPEVASPGAEIEVTWTVESDSADQRITLAEANQAIFTWVQAVKIDGGSKVTITLPDEPGTYEIRYLDVTNKTVLARKIIRSE